MVLYHYKTTQGENMANKTVKSISIPTSTRQHPAERLLNNAKKEDMPVIETPEIKPDIDPIKEEPIKKNKGGRPKKEKKKAQFSITMDPDLYKSVKEYAESKNISFSQIMVNSILQYMENDKGN